MLTAFSTSGLFLLNLHQDEAKTEWREIYREMGRIQKKVFPREGVTGEDRIEEQLQYIPTSKKIKQILLFDEHKLWKKSGVTSGREIFITKRCPVDSCIISYNTGKVEKADMVITRRFQGKSPMKHDKQVWLAYNLESAENRKAIDEANWTATYRTDSTLVTPYGRWQYFDEEQYTRLQTRNFARGRKASVAWMVSNCDADNQRLAYAKELAKYIKVDIYGKCGTLKCPKNDNKCWENISKEYKFYLSFENTNCKEYITEKFWSAIQHKVLPIVMGAREEDYKVAAPLNSFIHVDNFDNPKELASYLHKLDSDDSAYNAHFKWVGTGALMDTKFMCRACALLHHPCPPPFHAPSIQTWWWGEETCTPVSWDKDREGGLRKVLRVEGGDVP